MPRNFRILILAAACTFASTPVMAVFPPCPLGIRLTHLDQTSGSGSHPSWLSAFYKDKGTLTPETFHLPCQTNFPMQLIRDPSSKCDADLLRLTELPRSELTRPVSGPLTYSNAGWIGYVALPELRTAEADGRTVEYTYNLAVDAIPLAHPGDWVDIAELTFLQNDTSERSTTYRLRKIHTAMGSHQLQLIASTSVGTTAVPSHAVVASFPLIGALEYHAILMTWTTSTRWNGTAPPPLPSKSASPLPQYSVDTRFALSVDRSLPYKDVLYGQMPDDLSMGVLDYNLPHPVAVTSVSLHDTAALESFTGTTSPVTLPPDAPGSVLKFPTTTLRARAL